MQASKYKEKEEYIFLGHSFGGYMGSHYVTKFPEKINKVVLMSPVGLPSRPDDYDPERFISSIKS